MDWIARCVRPGMTVVDVGANVGKVAKPLAAAVGPTGQVVAIEPHAQLADQLRGCGATVLTLALGDHDGVVGLHHSRLTPHASVYLENVLEPIDQVEVVRLATLDQLQQTGEVPTPVHAIKIDAQGAEAAIVRGASQLLARDRPAVFLEIWPMGLTHAGSSVAALCDTLDALGYAPYHNSWPVIADGAAHCEGHAALDVLCLPKEQVT